MTSDSDPLQSADMKLARAALQSLNFFMADMQAGIGPFLGVFLQQRGWTTGPIGTVMTAQGLGYHVAFYVLGAFAVISVGLWTGFAGTLRPACDGERE